MLTIWGRKSSSNVQAVLWCIAELGLPHVRHDAGLTYGVNTTPEFLAMNPNGMIPVLRDGDAQPLWETGAILRYLCNRYASGPFWPEDPHARAQVDKWAEWSKINMAMSFTMSIFWRLVRTPPQDRDGAAIAVAVDVLTKKLAIAEAQLGRHAFLAGDAMTLADIQFGHVLFRYFDVAIARADLPGIAAYYERLQTRPPFREHVMVSYDELKVG